LLLRVADGPARVVSAAFPSSDDPTSAGHFESHRDPAANSVRRCELPPLPVCRSAGFRDGIYKFSLPGVSIEVAEECSGIRSSLSLIISSLLAGYVLLQSSWCRFALSTMTVPVVILKNAARIVTIWVLGVYVDPGFLNGRLHRYGGLPFSVFALALLTPLFIALIRVKRFSCCPSKQRTSRTDLEISRIGEGQQMSGDD
jgi:exosortase/archaeosortase family protein